MSEQTPLGNNATPIQRARLWADYGGIPSYKSLINLSFSTGLDSSLFRLVTIQEISRGRTEEFRDLYSTDAVDDWLASAVEELRLPESPSDSPPDSSQLEETKLQVLVINRAALQADGGSDNLYTIWDIIYKRFGMLEIPLVYEQASCTRHGGEPGETVHMLSEESPQRRAWKYSCDILRPGWTAWVSVPSKRSTIVVVLVDKHAEYEAVNIAPVSSRAFSACALSHPMAWPILLIHCKWVLAFRGVNETRTSLREIKKVTGMHRKASIDSFGADKGGKGRDVSGDLSSLIMTNLRFTDDATHMEHRCRTLVAFIGFVRRQCLAVGSGGENIDLQDIDQHFGVVLDYYEQQFRLTVDHFINMRTTCGFLMQGLQTLIAQRDQQATIQLALESKRIAEDSKRLARDSKRIAEDSWKDTTSMTAITVITMFFLPGTFLSVGLLILLSFGRVAV